MGKTLEKLLDVTDAILLIGSTYVTFNVFPTYDNSNKEVVKQRLVYGFTGYAAALGTALILRKRKN